ncbi:hypothetical protein RJ639_010587 [Escallonia herrerae]|uniref:Retrotransposon Copia-like N-terminal domain-containing protein n=1 Tax=Escallonia herrerae TaxID=1293975 RepID=A0AA88VQN4_9ASTE|nr:hypothetical protein RJ639_010587 [Escallonia herrerae]
MASSSSTSIVAATSPSLVTSTHTFSVKLTSKNYVTWKTQFLPILNYQNLHGHIDGTSSPPPKTIVSPTAENLLIPNPEYEAWFKKDQLLVSWLFSSLTEEIFPYIIGLSTSQEVWTALAHSFGSVSQNRQLQLYIELQELKKNDLSISEYLHKAKSLSDELSAAGKPVSPAEFNAIIYRNIGSDYHSIITALNLRQALVSFYELHEMASGGGKSQQGVFLGVLQKAKGKRKEKQPSVELPPAPKRTRVTPSKRSPRILEQVSIEDDPIFRPRWALRRDDLGMPDSQVSEQHLRHGILPRDKEVFQNQTHETFACSFAQAVYTMYASGSEMFSRFEMARQVAAEEAQLTREAVKEAQEATHRAEELSKREENHLDQIATLEKKLERVKKRAAEEVTKARDQGIRDFLDGNAGDEWLKKRTEDGLEIYELGFVKAKEMFAERFPDIP